LHKVYKKCHFGRKPGALAPPPSRPPYCTGGAYLDGVGEVRQPLLVFGHLGGQREQRLRGLGAEGRREDRRLIMKQDDTSTSPPPPPPPHHHHRSPHRCPASADPWPSAGSPEAELCASASFSPGSSCPPWARPCFSTMAASRSWISPTDRRAA